MNPKSAWKSDSTQSQSVQITTPGDFRPRGRDVLPPF
jgi:hypothetical protein